MNGIVFYPAGNSPALTYAARRLAEMGCNLSNDPNESVTHLLLPVPSFDNDGNIRGGGDLRQVLAALPENITVVGGNLGKAVPGHYKSVDLLQDERYLAENAAITADCALQIARVNLPIVLKGCSTLILGWGRIGKCLGQMLKAVGAEVTVAVRKESDLAMLQALGYRAVRIDGLHYSLMRYRLIFNTAPAPVLRPEQRKHCRNDCVLIDLASCAGIAGDNVIHARGLPGKDAPESTGLLMAQAILRLTAGREY